MLNIGSTNNSLSLQAVQHCLNWTKIIAQLNIVTFTS